MRGKKRQFSLSVRKFRRPPPALVGFRPSDLHAKCVLGSEEEWEIYKGCLVLCHFVARRYDGERRKEAKELIKDLKKWIDDYASKFENVDPEERKKRSIRYLDEEILIFAVGFVDIKYECGHAMDDWDQIKKDIRSWVGYDF